MLELKMKRLILRIKKIIFSQLNECLKGVKDEDIKNIIIAYEPIEPLALMQIVA